MSHKEIISRMPSNKNAFFCRLIEEQSQHEIRATSFRFLKYT